jgi:hypothetical protein
LPRGNNAIPGRVFLDRRNLRLPFRRLARTLESVSALREVILAEGNIVDAE